MGKRQKTGREIHWARRLGLGKTAAKAFKRLPPPRHLSTNAAIAAEDAAVEEAKKPAPRKKQRFPVPYKAEHRILLVGEGNFSFASALATLLGGEQKGICATSFDDAATVDEKYPDAQEHCQTILDHGGTVLHGVDATNLEDLRDQFDVESLGLFDIVVFNFPHTGAGIKDQALNIEANQRLVQTFIRSAFQLVHPAGQVHVTIKGGEPYASWRVAKLGVSLEDVSLKTANAFFPDQYPGYQHRRTIGFEEGLSTVSNEDIGTDCRTFMFIKKQQVAAPKIDEDDAALARESGKHASTLKKRKKQKGGKRQLTRGKAKGQMRKGKRERNASLAVGL